MLSVLTTYKTALTTSTISRNQIWRRWWHINKRNNNMYCFAPCQSRIITCLAKNKHCAFYKKTGSGPNQNNDCGRCDLLGLCYVSYAQHRCCWINVIHQCIGFASWANITPSPNTHFLPNCLANNGLVVFKKKLRCHGNIVSCWAQRLPKNTATSRACSMYWMRLANQTHVFAFYPQLPYKAITAMCVVNENECGFRMYVWKTQTYISTHINVNMYARVPNASTSRRIHIWIVCGWRWIVWKSVAVNFYVRLGSAKIHWTFICIALSSCVCVSFWTVLLRLFSFRFFCELFWNVFPIPWLMRVPLRRCELTWAVAHSPVRATTQNTKTQNPKISTQP